MLNRELPAVGQDQSLTPPFYVLRFVKKEHVLRLIKEQHDILHTFVISEDFDIVKRDLLHIHSC